MSATYLIQRRNVGLPRYRVIRLGSKDAEFSWNRQNMVLGEFWTHRQASRWIAKSRWHSITEVSR